MSKTFTYFKKTGEIRRPVNYGDGIEYEWDGDEGYDFEYEPNYDDLKQAVVEVATDYYFEDIIKKHPELKTELREKVENVMNDYDMYDDMADAFEDELKEYFEDEAQDSEY